MALSPVHFLHAVAGDVGGSGVGICVVQQNEQAGHVIASNAGGRLGVLREAALADFLDNVRRLHACIQPLAHEVDLHIVKDNFNHRKYILGRGNPPPAGC